MTGSVVRIKGLQRFCDRRTGRVYCYHRATGTRLKAEIGTPEFFRELHAAEALAERERRRTSLPKTLGELITLYRERRIANLAPRTRRDYEKLLLDLKAIFDMPLAAIDRPFIARLRDDRARERSWHYSNYLLAVLSSVFKLGEEYGVMTENPVLRVAKLKRPKDRPRVNRPWTEGECAAVLEAAQPHLRLPLALAIEFGLRIGDIVRIPKTAFRDGWYETTKRGIEIYLKATPAIRREILRAPAHDAITLCANSRGQSWTED
jgi:hypothetical protein